MDSGELALQQAIATLSQTDPLIKLLQQVQLGRMKPTDAGLRAITESWLTTYQGILAKGELSRQALKRLDPMPRVAMLIDTGMLSSEHPAVITLRTTFEQAFERATK